HDRCWMKSPLIFEMRTGVSAAGIGWLQGMRRRNRALMAHHPDVGQAFQPDGRKVSLERLTYGVELLPIARLHANGEDQAFLRLGLITRDDGQELAAGAAVLDLALFGGCDRQADLVFAVGAVLDDDRRGLLIDHLEDALFLRRQRARLPQLDGEALE